MGKVYYFDPAGNTLEKGGHVVVETARGVECGEVVIPNKQVSDETLVRPLKPVLRAANPEDLKRARENAEREQKAMVLCQERIAAHKLDMKLVDVCLLYTSTANSTITGPGSAKPNTTPIPTPVRAEWPRASEKKAMPLLTTRVPSRENSGMIKMCIRDRSWDLWRPTHNRS